MSEFKNIRFFDGLEEISPEIAAKDKYFIHAYNGAKAFYNFVIDDINNHDGILVLNNSDRAKMIGLDNISDELKQILVSKGAWK
jgi:ribosome biogenesis protein Nip4